MDSLIRFRVTAAVNGGYCIESFEGPEEPICRFPITKCFIAPTSSEAGQIIGDQINGAKVRAEPMTLTVPYYPITARSFPK